jgi:hypothetical protein
MCCNEVLITVHLREEKYSNNYAEDHRVSLQIIYCVQFNLLNISVGLLFPKGHTDCILKRTGLYAECMKTMAYRHHKHRCVPGEELNLINVCTLSAKSNHEIIQFSLTTEDNDCNLEL